MFHAFASLSFFIFTAAGQQVGSFVAEIHPSLLWSKCTSSGCTTQPGKITLDANWRWVHDAAGYSNCFTSVYGWDPTLCPDGKTCATKCALEGADYTSTYGISTSGNAVTLKLITANGSGRNIGSRIYLMNNDTRYEKFNPLGQEFAFDVDLAKLPCGVNGALHLSEMDADGGTAKYPTNKAGAKYGTGYCDSRCPRDVKFINGEANLQGWVASPRSNTGTGKWGACCSEMDIWDANRFAAVFTSHPCSATGLSRCEGSSCGTTDPYATVCDPDGCDFNSYRMGNTSFYGPGQVVNTSSKFTVVTQFLTDNGSSSGTLQEIRRLYVQNGKVIQNSKVNIPGLDPSMDSITDAYCKAQKSVFGDEPQFQNKGGLAQMGKALANGMVLVLSIAEDPTTYMTWLGSTFPVDADPSKPGVQRGPCATSTGIPTEIDVVAQDAQVTFSNIRFGSLGSTYGSGATRSTDTSVAH